MEHQWFKLAESALKDLFCQGFGCIWVDKDVCNPGHTSKACWFPWLHAWHK